MHTDPHDVNITEKYGILHKYLELLQLIDVKSPIFEKCCFGSIYPTICTFRNLTAGPAEDVEHKKCYLTFAVRYKQVKNYWGY